MRKLIFGTNISIDGCCDHTKLTGYEDVHTYFTQLMQGAGLLAYGRITYQLMVPFWPEFAKNHSGPPTPVSEFARVFSSVNKVVFSRTLKEVEDKNTKIVSTGIKDEITRLKQEEGKDILLGGVDVPLQLIEFGLVDEFHFVVQPIVAGGGRRLLEAIKLQEKLQLKLVESNTFKSGCVALHYVKN